MLPVLAVFSAVRVLTLPVRSIAASMQQYCDRQCQYSSVLAALIFLATLEYEHLLYGRLQYKYVHRMNSSTINSPTLRALSLGIFSHLTALLAP